MLFHYSQDAGEKSSAAHNVTFVISALLFLLLSQSLHAQYIARFAVYQARGDKFLMAYDGQVRVYRPEPLPSGGISLQRNDQIQTKEGTLELRSYPHGLSLFAGDNSSVVFENSTNNSRTQVFSLNYGRVRIINTMNTQAIIVRAGLSLIEIETGDVNIDYAVYPWMEGSTGESTLVISTLKGGALITIPPGTENRAAIEQRATKAVRKKVSAKERVSVSTKRQIKMNEGESLFIDPILSIVEKREVYKEVEEYWIRRGYGDIEPVQRYMAGYSPVLNTSPPLIERQPLTTSPAPKKKKKAPSRVPGTIAGILLMTAGAGMVAAPIAAPDVFPDKNTQSTVFVGGFVPIGLGLVTIIGTMLR